MTAKPRTIEQRTNHTGFPKPGELIEITGAHALEASDRAILNVLYQHAHDSGNISELGATWELPVARLRPSAHESNDRIRASIERLLSVVVSVPYDCEKTGDRRTVLTHLFDFIDLPPASAGLRSTVTYALPRKLVPVVQSSGRWGRIKGEVVLSMTSKYAISLYELIQLRGRMERCVETFPIGRFRDLMQVPPGKLERGPDFHRYCVEPALVEVNGLSEYHVLIDYKRRGPRSPIEAVTVAWSPKEGDEYREVLRERARPKVGRMARLKGKADKPQPALPGLN